MRSIWKSLNINRKKKSGLIILKKDIGSRVNIYNGKEDKTFLLKGFMIGYYYGEFFLTKKLGKEIHVKVKKNKGKK